MAFRGEATRSIRGMARPYGMDRTQTEGSLQRCGAKRVIARLPKCKSLAASGGKNSNQRLRLLPRAPYFVGFPRGKLVVLFLSCIPRSGLLLGCREGKQWVSM